MFDIDKRDKNGYTILHHAILRNNPIIVELLLKEYDANPNVVDKNNTTTLLHWASKPNRNLSILRLLVNYRFDFAKLVNKSENKDGYNVFHYLCFKGDTDHNISCLKHLFSICKKIPRCSINILARQYTGACGLHHAIFQKSVDMIKYLLENVYFPNNDKLNKDGVAFINMKVASGMSLGKFVVAKIVAWKDGNVKRDLEMLKLLVSYGMKFNSQDNSIFVTIIIHQYVEIAAFILNQNLSPIYNLDRIMYFMYEVPADHYVSVNTEILQSLYDYGSKHGLISNKSHHLRIITKAAQYNLAVFRTTMLMILEKYGINDSKQYKQCGIIDETTLKTIVQSPTTKPDVKSFIQALTSDDETELCKLDADTSNDAIITCINNHELKITHDNKILNCREKCSVCGDTSNGSQSLCGLKCDECKSFICDDCIIVQKLSKKINNSSNNKNVLIAAGNQILQYKNKKQSLNKVELHDKMLSHVFLIVCL